MNFLRICIFHIFVFWIWYCFAILLLFCFDSFVRNDSVTTNSMSTYLLSFIDDLMFPSGPRGLCSNPGRVITKTKKILHAALLSTQHYMVSSISFQTFFVHVFKIVVDSWKFAMLLLYILWDDWPICMISGLNEHPHQEMEYTLLSLIVTAGEFQKCSQDVRTLYKNDMLLNCVLNLEKCRKNVWNASDCFSTILHESSISFLSGIRDSRKAGSLWGMTRGVGGVRKFIHQSWLAKGLGLGLLCWGFKGVQEEIPSEEASTLQIGSVAFPPGQCASPQLYPCHRLFD